MVSWAWEHCRPSDVCSSWLIRKGDTTSTRNYGLFLTGGTQGRIHFSMGIGTGWLNERLPHMHTHGAWGRSAWAWRTLG